MASATKEFTAAIVNGAQDNNGEYILPNIDNKYGPYLTTAAALEAIPEEARAIGLTIGIYSGFTPYDEDADYWLPKGTIKEYWFQGGCEDSNLVEKGASGSSITIEMDETTETLTITSSDDSVSINK